MKPILILALTALAPSLLFSFVSNRTVHGCGAKRADLEAEAGSQDTEVERILARMSLEEKVGQLFIIAGNANEKTLSGPAFETLKRGVKEFHAGGIIWYRSGVAETARLNETLQKEARIPLLIAADLEAGMGMRFDDTPWSPWAMALAATGRPEYAETLGFLTAVEARALGITQIYAPVADVNINPGNPVINTRSFGEDAEDVSKFVNAFVAGCTKGRVLATVKHFPGHGDTAVDSHRSLPVLRMDRARLDAIELLPFRKAFAAGCPSVMVAHVAVPALDDTPAPLLKNAVKTYGGDEEREQRGTMPATVSRKVVTDLLRREMKFDGIVVTDAMDMGGLADHFDPREGAIRAIEAGCDHILKSGDPFGAIEAVVAAVKSRRIPESRIDESVRRTLRFKLQLGLFVNGGALPAQGNPAQFVNTKEHALQLREMAERSITLLREKPGVLPLKKGGKIAHLAVSDEVGKPGFVYSNLAFTTPLEEQGAEVVEFKISPKTTKEEMASIIERARGFDAIVASLNVKARTGAGAIRTPEQARRALSSLQKDGPPVVMVALGSPYVLDEVPDAETFLVAYGSADVSQRAAAAALFGKINIGGRLPVTIPKLAKRGSGISKPAEARK